MKSFFPPLSRFKEFFSNSLVSHDKQKKAKNTIFCLTNFLTISLFAFTFKKRLFKKKQLLRTTLRHVCTSCVYRKAACGKFDF